MYKVILPLLVALLFTGCIQPPMQQQQTQHKIAKYREFKNYNTDILPLLEKGYAIVRDDTIHQKRNITPEQFIAKMRTYGYHTAEFVMVKTLIKDGYYNFRAIYLRKINVNGMVLGAALQSEMPMQIREAFGSNKGCALGKIYYNTPAYKYDLHENDIVTYVNGTEILSCKHLKHLLNKYETVDFKVWADGETIYVNDIVLNK